MLSWAPSSLPQEDLSNPCERDGLKLVEEPTSQLGRSARDGSAPPDSLAPLSAGDWAIVVGVAALLLTYVMTMGLCVRWLLHWLMGP